jgi:P-type Ca2+ transporter type 2C
MNDVARLASADVSVRVRSALPGRFRIWVAGLYRNEELKRALEGTFGAREGKRVVAANLVLGTLLVTTEGDAKADELVSEIEALVRDFADQQKIQLHALERRGRLRPVYFSQNGKSTQNGKHETEAWSLSRGEAKTQAPSPRRKKAGPQAAQAGEEQREELWHTLDPERVFAILRIESKSGLGEQEARERLARFGVNALPQPPKRSGLAMFFDQFKELPVLLLAGSTVLSMATGGVADGLVILGVIVINGVIGFVTEAGAERTIASLTRDDIPHAEVRRGGRILQISLDEIVPGDVLRLQPGGIVPADARLLEAKDLTVDESALTGESMPVAKSVGVIDDPELPLADRRNMVYRGTLVTGGNATAVVVATGRYTQVGHLQAMVGEVERPDTPMQKQLRHLGHRTVIIAGAVCGGVFAIGLLRGQPLGAMIRTAVSLAVAAVPEGLPTVAITTLAIGIRKMKAQHVIVRRLDAIETLGAVQVLCFDKTGTITENKMRVVQATAGDALLTVQAGKTSTKDGEVRYDARPELERLLHVGVLCSDAKLTTNGDGSSGAEGSSTEAAIVQFALAAGIDATKLRAEHPTLRCEHRTEERQSMITVHRSERCGHVVAVKGSPMEVLERCKHWLRNGEVVPLGDEDRRNIRRQNDRMAGDALRVLGMAYAEQDSQPDPFAVELTWLGMMGLADPPRPGLPELFAKFRRAGVRSVMITGDQSATAYAIAKQIGLAVDGELQTLDSVEIERMDPELLADIAPRIQVFSRVSPRHKLRIVQALQKSGLVVAMTGDGINDCPALKAADIGVAMGGAGGSVAREVADMILEKDNLASMLHAIEYGRVTHADIKKAVRFILATNTSEILLTLASVAAGFGEGMTPVQLLWINLVSDIFPELALAMQPPEHDVLERPPRDPEAKMFSRDEFTHMATEGAFLTLGALAVYTYGIRRYGMSPQASGISFVTLSTAQLLHAFSTRSERRHIFDAKPVDPNPYLPASVIGGIGLTILMQLFPATRRWLGSGGMMPPVDWLVAAGGAIGPLLINELLKARRFAELPAESELLALEDAAE